MSQAKVYRTSQFVWRELMTSDVARAKGFYGELLGWKFNDVPMPGGAPGMYTMILLGDAPIGGMSPMMPGVAMPPNWMSSVSVADVDATARAVEKAGGKVLMGPMDVPGMGRYGVVSDPTGAVLSIWRSNEGDGPGFADRPPLGAFCWESCNTTDVAKAKAFYAAVFGWGPAAGMPAEMNVIGPGDIGIADVNPAPAGVPSHWLTHVVVENLANSRGRAEKLGGTVLMADVPVPGIGNLCIVQDPAKATISLFQAAPPAKS